MQKKDRGGRERMMGSDPERCYLLCTNHFVKFFSNYRKVRYKDLGNEFLEQVFFYTCSKIGGKLKN